MAFFQSYSRAPSPVRRRVSVFAVGRRVYVSSSRDRLAHVALTDYPGGDALTHLADGTEVEILAWLPRASGDTRTRYRVRSTRSGLEGWLAVDNLRSTLSAVAAPSEAVPSGTAVVASCGVRDSSRRFHQRAH